ncbi:hypothetical protein A6R68_20505 [Neotoma lepida]|uniref:Transcription initiation factor TFIID subunit 12 n=1 Tax=Neotoma lepida TaxID=56216 RepID=A0A1A6HSP9_NEOLE|nr:hypothetical protein A6R68_20505 [Neotoma lepida]
MSHTLCGREEWGFSTHVPYISWKIGLGKFDISKRKNYSTYGVTKLYILKTIRIKMMSLDLIREVDPNEQWAEDVEGMLLKIADDFIDSVVTIACQMLLKIADDFIDSVVTIACQMLLKIADDFIDSVVTIACQLLSNYKPSTPEVKYLHLYLECQ